MFIIASNLSKAQDAILCPSYNSYIKIENASDVPTTSAHPDDTLNLTFAEQYITDLFSNYIVYDFYQTSPNSSSEEVLKYYTISHNSKALIEDIFTQIPSTTISIATGYNVDSLPIRSAITPNVIQVLDGNTYKVTQYIATADDNECSNNPGCALNEVPTDFNFEVTFNYDAKTELLIVENEGLSSCGNAFSIALSGGNPNQFGTLDNTLQLWEVNSIAATLPDYDQPCTSIESVIFTLLDIGCALNDGPFSNIIVRVDSEAQTVRFYRPNQVFGEYIIEFTNSNLSVADNRLNFITPFKADGNPYLKLSNTDSHPIYIEIYNVSGQLILIKSKFEDNAIDLSNYRSGLYFIKLSDLNNQQKTFKFLLSL